MGERTSSSGSGTARIRPNAPFPPRDRERFGSKCIHRPLYVPAGVYRAGCAGPHGAVVTLRAAVRCYYRPGRRVVP